MDITVVFEGVDTSDPSVVAQTVANFMYMHSDQLTPDEATAIFTQMYAYGVPEPQSLQPPPHLIGWPSMTG